MCGNCGWLTQNSMLELSDKKRLQRARILEGLLVANAARGTDASGLAIVSATGRSIYKQALPSIKFVEQPASRKLIRKGGRIAIAHTRYATTGDNTNENAHPFTVGHVTGAHNGIISNYIALDDALREHQGADVKDYRRAEVDSEVVFRLLDSVSPEDYLTTLERVQGSAALVWHDTRNTKGVWMVSHENPLNLALVPSLGTLFWSSQFDHLSSVLWGVFGDNWETVDIKQDTLYLFSGEDLTKPQSWPVTFPTYSMSVYGYGYGHGYGSSTHNAEDEDADADVKHPFVMAEVSRRARTTVGAAKASGGTGIPTGTYEALDRMGLPMDAGPVENTPASTSATGSTEEEYDGKDEWQDDDSCTICLGVTDDGAVFIYRTKSWVCRDCKESWEAQGMDFDMIEALVSA